MKKMMNLLIIICNFIIAEKDSNLIKEALLEIIKTTCIKIVPHTNEPDYVVFVEYKHPNQERGYRGLLPIL